MNTPSHRRLEALRQEHWTASVSSPAWQRVRRRRRRRLLSFIWPFNLDLWGLLLVISSPAGPQVAKNILPLFAQPACSILAVPPPEEGSLIWLWENQEEQKAIWQASPTPGKSSSWRLRQAVGVLLEYWWCHCSRSPPVSSSSDLCSERAGRGWATAGRSRVSNSFCTDKQRLSVGFKVL